MSIWVNQHTKAIVQGITGSAASYHTEQMLKYGTKIVAGVTPGKGGSIIFGVPVFDTVKEAVAHESVDASVIFVPAPYAADAIIEAVDECIPLIVCITEHIPVIDMIRVTSYMKGKASRLIGPNCSGIITPNHCKIGIMPGHIHKKGDIGIVSRSGTLTYEAVDAISKAGYGQSTAVGIGGDPVHGTDFIDVLDAFNRDKKTKAVVFIGEIGGDAEERAAEWIEKHMKKPVIGFISGKTAPKGKRMGHAGAIISGDTGTAQSKELALKKAGVIMADRFLDLMTHVEKVLSNES